ncbi:MAG: hypothetical protein KAZ87_01790 [Spirochaetes bacterium]|nr:hypothetical protein [Spirochaetota bacterium]
MKIESILTEKNFGNLNPGSRSGLQFPFSMETAISFTTPAALMSSG